MTIQETADFLKTHDNYLILTHIRPGNDPEALLDEARAEYPGAILAHAGTGYIV